MEPLERLRLANERKTQLAADAKKHHDLVMASIQTQETVLKSFSSLVDYLDNRVSRTKVVNQLTEIGTPDALRVVEAVNELHTTLKTHKNTDLSELTSLMRGVLKQAEQIPKSLPDTPEQKFVDYSKQFEGLERATRAVEKVVKQQKLVAEAPIVNVPQAKVNVEAPNLTPLQDSIKEVVKAVQAIVIPETKLDTAPVEKLLKKSNKLLGEILDKPVGGSGGGGRATPYQDSGGMPAFVELTVDGNVPVSAAALPLPTGAATSAKQDTGNTSLASIDTKMDALTTPSDTQPISAASLPLPTGAATAANQATANTSLSNIDTDTSDLLTEMRIMNGAMAMQVDDTTGTIYQGWAEPGALTSAASWRIRRIVGSGTPEDTAITFADGNRSFDNVWNNRASLSYS